MRAQPLIAGIAIVIISVGLAAADYVLSEKPRMIALEGDNASNPTAEASSSSASSSVGSSSSVSGVVKKGVSTKKATNVDVLSVVAQLQLIPQESGETDFLFMTTPNKALVQRSVLLRDNDRAFHVSWMESSDVKTVFAAIKQSLQEQFSGKVTDLVDETRTPENGPPADYLSFIDPVLSAERIVFLRVRTRLYEIHIAENGEALLEPLVAALSR